VGLACFSSTLTSLSMSGIATNGRVSAGGCYQIIKVSPQRTRIPPAQASKHAQHTHQA
jgi:hypothetical protein